MPTATPRLVVSCLLVLAAGFAVGCAPLGGSGACAIELPEPEPSRVAPEGSFRMHGEGFSSDCYDTGQPGRPPPEKGIEVEFRQGARAWDLGEVDADRDSNLDARLTVPGGAEPGRAVVVLRADSGLPLKVPLRVVGGGGCGGVGGGSC